MKIQIDQDFLEIVDSENNNFNFEDGFFSFWTVSYSDSKRICFRVRQDMTPNEQIIEKCFDPNFNKLEQSSSVEIIQWMIAHNVEFISLDAQSFYRINKL